MRTSICPRWIVATIIFFMAACVSVDAAPPVAASPTTTFWNYLGIPQAFHKMRDGTSNRLGNNPNRERTPPLKRIADPANLESENPAIKKAAQIKAEEDLAPQKIKAIKYLATVGCGGCYDGVQDALLKALDDCTEEVRYEAAVAFCMAAGSPCQSCGTSCCNAKVMQKLHEKAFGQDEKCCYKESSARVRAAAERALNSCKRKVGPTTATPTPVVPPVKPPETPPDEPTEAPAKADAMPATPDSPAPATEEEMNKKKKKDEENLKSKEEENPTQSSLKILTPPEANGGIARGEREPGSVVVIQASATEPVVKPMPVKDIP